MQLVFMLHLQGIVRFDKRIQAFLQVIQRQLEFSSESWEEKILLQQPEELLATIAIGLAGEFHWQVLDVGSGKVSFKWMHGWQTAIFVRFSSVNFFDGNAPILEKRHHAACQNIDGIHRIFCGINLCKCDTGITVHDGFNVNAAGPGNVANILDLAEEEQFLE